MATESKISFSSLSGGLKALVVTAWIFFSIMVLAFLAGFISGLVHGVTG